MRFPSACWISRVDHRARAQGRPMCSLRGHCEPGAYLSCRLPSRSGKSAGDLPDQSNDHAGRAACNRISFSVADATGIPSRYPAPILAELADPFPTDGLAIASLHRPDFSEMAARSWHPRSGNRAMSEIRFPGDLQEVVARAYTLEQTTPNSGKDRFRSGPRAFPRSWPFCFESCCHWMKGKTMPRTI